MQRQKITKVLEQNWETFWNVDRPFCSNIWFIWQEKGSYHLSGFPFVNLRTYPKIMLISKCISMRCQRFFINPYKYITNNNSFFKTSYIIGIVENAARSMKMMNDASLSSP